MKGDQGETKREIIKLLQQYKSLTYSTLKELLGITDAAISRQLSRLVKEKTIIFTKEGTSKHYRINPEALKQFETRISIISQNYNMLFEGDMDLNEQNYEKILKYVSNTVSALFLFTLIKSIDTGKNWFKAFDSKELAEMTLLNLMTKVIDDKTQRGILREDLLKKGFEVFFNEIRKKQNKRSKEELHEMLETIEEMYPREIEILEKEAPEQLDDM